MDVIKLLPRLRYIRFAAGHVYLWHDPDGLTLIDTGLPGSAGSADEAAQVAREVLARHDVSAPVRTQFWSPRDQEWREAADEPSADPVAEQQALHEARQERERQASVTSGRPAWEVWVELPSHDDVVHLAGHLAAQG